MTTKLELLFHNTFNIMSLFQKYDEDGYPIEEDFEDDLEEEGEIDDDDGFDGDDELEEDSWE